MPGRTPAHYSTDTVNDPGANSLDRMLAEAADHTTDWAVRRWLLALLNDGDPAAVKTSRRQEVLRQEGGER